MIQMHDFRQQRVADFQTAQRLLSDTWNNKSLPVLTDVTTGCVVTPVATVLLLNLLVILLTQHGRKRTWEIVEAVLASLLMLCLLVAVLGMPIGTLQLNVDRVCAAAKTVTVITQTATVLQVLHIWS